MPPRWEAMGMKKCPSPPHPSKDKGDGTHAHDHQYNGEAEDDRQNQSGAKHPGRHPGEGGRIAVGASQPPSRGSHRVIPGDALVAPHEAVAHGAAISMNAYHAGYVLRPAFLHHRSRRGPIARPMP
jgi:hypothetical protein